MSPAKSRRHFLLMGLVTAGVIKTTGISDSHFADSLIDVSYAGGPEDDRGVTLGAAAIHNQRRKKTRLQTSTDLDNGAYTGEITIEHFGGPGVKGLPSTNSPRFDTPPPGTRQRLRRRKARRKKIKRVVDHVVDFLMPAAHASTPSTRRFDFTDTRLHVEIDEQGRWGVAFSANDQGQYRSFVGTAESVKMGVYLDPAGPGCLSADPDLDISVSLIAINERAVDFALTAHYVDEGLAFAAFGRLPKAEEDDGRPVANWCQPNNEFKRSPFFP